MGTLSLSCRTALAHRRCKQSSKKVKEWKQSVYVRGKVMKNGMPAVEAPTSPKGYPRRAAGAKACEKMALEFQGKVLNQMMFEDGVKVESDEWFGMMLRG